MSKLDNTNMVKYLIILGIIYSLLKLVPDQQIENRDLFLVLAIIIFTFYAVDHIFIKTDNIRDDFLNTMGLSSSIPSQDTQSSNGNLANPLSVQTGQNPSTPSLLSMLTQQLATQPVVQDTTQPATQPVLQQLATQPVVQQPLAQQPVQQLAQQPVQQLAQQPVVQQPLAQQPVQQVQQPVVQQPLQQVQQPVMQPAMQPTMQPTMQPVVQQPVVQQPVVQQPVQNVPVPPQPRVVSPILSPRMQSKYRNELERELDGDNHYNSRHDNRYDNRKPIPSAEQVNTINTQAKNIVYKYFTSLITDLLEKGVLNSDDVSNINMKVDSKLVDISDVISSLEQLKREGKAKVKGQKEVKNDAVYNELDEELSKPIGGDISNKWESQYSILNTSKWKVPMARPPVCVNTNPCQVCPTTYSGYVDLASWDNSRVLSTTNINKKWAANQMDGKQ
jgi:hypothetical protein